MEDVAAAAIRLYARGLEHSRRWIAHYENRLAYERAMLAEDGGIAADQFDILQPGGQVQVRGEWLNVVRVNRKEGRIVSVTTDCRFVRVKGIEEVRDYKAPSAERAAAVRAITKKPPLANYPHPGAVEMTQAEWKRTHADYKGTREAGQGARQAGFFRPNCKTGPNRRSMDAIACARWCAAAPWRPYSSQMPRSCSRPRPQRPRRWQDEHASGLEAHPRGRAARRKPCGCAHAGMPRRSPPVPAPWSN